LPEIWFGVCPAVKSHDTKRELARLI